MIPWSVTYAPTCTFTRMNARPAAAGMPSAEMASLRRQLTPTGSDVARAISRATIASVATSCGARRAPCVPFTKGAEPKFSTRMASTPPLGRAAGRGETRTTTFIPVRELVGVPEAPRARELRWAAWLVGADRRWGGACRAQSIRDRRAPGCPHALARRADDYAEVGWVSAEVRDPLEVANTGAEQVHLHPGHQQPARFVAVDRTHRADRVEV